MHSIANLAALQTPLTHFFPFKKKAPKPYLVSEIRVCLSAQFLFSARAHISLSLSLSLSLSVLINLETRLNQLSIGFLFRNPLNTRRRSRRKKRRRRRRKRRSDTTIITITVTPEARIQCRTAPWRRRSLCRSVSI